jgi:hypothetical protein
MTRLSIAGICESVDRHVADYPLALSKAGEEQHHQA